MLNDISFLVNFKIKINKYLNKNYIKNLNSIKLNKRYNVQI